MNENHFQIIADELGLKSSQVKAVVSLLEDGATVPFIARYRKELTESLDEVAISAVRDTRHRLTELDNRRDTILKTLEKNGHLTDELKNSIAAAPTLAVLEDIYLPFRPKRRTRATIAREKGLAPLADVIFSQQGINTVKAAENYLDAEKGLDDIEAVLAGARDIIAEFINENKHARHSLRELFELKGMITSRVATGMEKQGFKYQDYFHWEELARSTPSHRVLAMRRAEKEDILNLAFLPPEEDALLILEDLFVSADGDDSAQVKLAAHDCYKRLLSRSMETGLRLSIKEKADTAAIEVFAENLRNLLLAPPAGPKRVMGIDPGFKTGCKIVCLDRQGQFITKDTIFPHSSSKKIKAAADTVASLCDNCRIEAIAVGNGTAGRETKTFLDHLTFANKPPVILVDESGASIYSASKAARQEFPDLDLTFRGAVSIGRRFMDPLAELVKIDPKSIGVGQYQHDVDQSALKKTLDDIVISCVNSVGVDVNRASPQLLTYVSGLGSQLAANIVQYRNEHGPFKSREALKSVPRLGPRAFQQSAGFLRIMDGENPLDASAVHPESYAIVDRMASDLGCDIQTLMSRPELRNQIDLSNYVRQGIGIPTLNDIVEEIARPGRDPRQTFEIFEFTEGIEKVEDLEPGMTLPGIVTNVTAFGAFVDVGVHQDGLVHISELSHRYVKNPADIVKVQQKVSVKVIDVDLERNRISLSMKTRPSPAKSSAKKTRKRLSRKPRKRSSGPKKTTQKTPEPFHNPFADLLNRTGN
jgi:uncharacterized protein